MKAPKELEPRIPKPAMWDQEAPSVKRRSMENEKRLGKRVGFKTTPGSGNQVWPSKKGDGQHIDVLFELKETTKDKISVGTKVVAKVCQEARAVSKIPAIVLSAYGIPEPYPREWVVVPVDFFQELLKVWNERERDE